MLGDWLSLAADEDDEEGEESLVNDCGVAITSLDLQLSDSEDGDPLSHLSDLPSIAGDSIFNTFQVFDTDSGSVLRLFSSVGNSFSSFCFECSPDGTALAVLHFFRITGHR